MALRKPTIRNYQRKKQRAFSKDASSSSKSRLRGYSFASVEDIEKGKSLSIGAALASKLKGSAQQKRQKLAIVDKEIANAFSGKKSLLNYYLSSLPVSERAALRTYASARIARVVDKLVRKKFGKIERYSENFKLDKRQQQLIFSLLSGIPGVSKQALQQAIENQTAILSKTEQHFQFSVAHFLESYVFSDKPKMSLRKALERYQFAIMNSSSYAGFVNYLSQPDKKESNGSLSQIKMLRLAGLQWEIKGKQLIFSKGDRESTKIHEAVHNILNNSGAIDLSFSESFTHFVSCFVAEKTGVGIDYLSDAQRKQFDSKTALAITNFPWGKVTMQDVAKIAGGIKREIDASPGIKNKLYAGYFEALTPKVAPLFFDLLEKKLPRYSREDKRIVKEIAVKGIVDCKGRNDLIQVRKRLERLVQLAN